MKNILRIARIELSLLFYSPVAWIVLIVFVVQAGWQYTSLIERMETAQQMGQVMDDLTSTVFTGFFSLFPKMQEYLYLYIPLLTMGLISREIHSGSIKLLYSSPIRMIDIVAGKYLAMITYCFVLMSVLLGTGLISLFTIDHVDLLFVLSGTIGLFLLTCAYSAIGLFMSSLTSYQVVAAISTLVVLAALNFVGGLWQDIDFVRDITYFLSISGRAEESINGLIGSNDILYFIIVILLFLGLTILKLQFERRTISFLGKFLRYTLFISVMLLAGYLSAMPQFMGYVDMTRNNRRTLTDSSKKVINKFTEPVLITTYVNLLDENYFLGLPSYQNDDKKHFDMYSRFMPYMKFEYILYWDHSQNERLYQENPGLNDEQIAMKMAKITGIDFKKFLRPEQIKNIIDLKPERNRLVRVISYKNKKVTLRMFDDLFKNPAEKEITAALKRLIVNAPKIGFVDSHAERSINRSGDKDYQIATNEISFRYSLINQGFEVNTIKLDQPALKKKVDVLVISDPKIKYAAQELENLATYIKDGGNLMLAVEPGNGAVANPILSLTGASIGEGMLVQKSKDYEPSFVISGLSGKNWKQLMPASSFIKLDSPFVITPTATPIKIDSSIIFDALPVLVTQAANTWQINGYEIDPSAELKDARQNQDKKSYPVAFALRRKHQNSEQRILLIGDADFMSNKEMSRSKPKAINFSFVTELFGWFSHGEFPIDTTREEPIDNKILLNSTQVAWMRWTFLGFLPALIALTVSWMLIRRKRR